MFKEKYYSMDKLPWLKTLLLAAAIALLMLGLGMWYHNHLYNDSNNMNLDAFWFRVIPNLRNLFVTAPYLKVPFVCTGIFAFVLGWLLMTNRKPSSALDKTNAKAGWRAFGLALIGGILTAAFLIGFLAFTDFLGRVYDPFLGYTGPAPDTSFYSIGMFKDNHLGLDSAQLNGLTFVFAGLTCVGTTLIFWLFKCMAYKIGIFGMNKK